MRTASKSDGKSPDGTQRTEVCFEAAAVTVTLVLLGQVLELPARQCTSAALCRLLSLAPPIARKIRGRARRRAAPPEFRFRVRQSLRLQAAATRE
ncbi:MAG: hypothetical protein K2X38_21085 [Gemmataceae bacterium]|nr:hypothetical protein [Gemmataceae bacterium]